MLVLTEKKHLLIGALLLFLAFCHWCPEASAAEPVPLRLVSILEVDDQGMKFGFPHSVHYDRFHDETYLISSTGRITVYDNKFFPQLSFGPGRGLVNPRGITFDAEGNIYVCHGLRDSPVATPRLTVLSPAFFPVREIIFADIPELASFQPQRVAVAADGKIYLSGSYDQDMAGVMVLDKEGRFLRRLAPEDRVNMPRKRLLAEKAQKELFGKKAAQEGDEAQEEQLDKEDHASEEVQAPEGLPAGLKPTSSGRDQEVIRKDQDWPVYISDVVIDQNGRIYLLSREVSHVYVYNEKEEFLFKFGEKGGADRKLSNPVSMAVDYERRIIYVCDYMRHTILSYDYDTGRFIFELGGRGTSPLWFNFPNSMEVDNQGRLIVSDLFNRRVQVMDPNMQARRPIVPPQIAAVEKPVAPEQQAQVEPVAAPVPDPDAVPEIAAAAVEQPPVVAPPPVAAPPSVAAMAPPPVLAGVPAAPMQLAGLAEAVVVAPESPLQLVPERPVAELAPVLTKKVVAPPKRIRPTRLKKVAAPTPPAPPVAAPLATVAPTLIPEKIPPPEIKVVPVKDARVSNPEAAGPWARIIKLPAALGVYGPVAALMGIGSWLLYQNR